MGGRSLLGLGAAATGLVGCSEAGQSSGADADAATMGRLFNGMSAESSEIYPFEYKELEINGRRIHYVDEGSGPTVSRPSCSSTGRATGPITIGA